MGARSLEELEASVCHSFSGIKVVWIRSVVSYWETICDRCCHPSLKDSYSFEIALNKSGVAVLRTKDAMPHTDWLPLGGLEYAPPVLAKAVTEHAAFSFVVPGVHEVSALRSSIMGMEDRISLPRSHLLFPSEEPGAAFRWWMSFLDSEEKRMKGMCQECCNQTGIGYNCRISKNAGTSYEAGKQGKN